MAIITLTTDFGEKDHFAGAVKGAIYSEMLDAKIVDISHSVSPFSVPEAAYIILNAYSSFPKGTIHLIGIDSELTPETNHIAVKLDGHYFICANNGIMSMICSEITPEKIVDINIHSNIQSSFAVLDVFVKVACHIARGGTLEVIGKVINKIRPIKNLLPFVNDEMTQIIGSVIYIDNYGNVISNITRKFFDTYHKQRKYEVLARNTKFQTIFNNYSDFIDFETPIKQRFDLGRKMVVFNSSNYLEVSIYKGNTLDGSASSLFGLKMGDTITINFFKD